MKPRKIEARYVEGAGWTLYADVPESVFCGEFTLAEDFQPIIETEVYERQAKMGYGPWVQFPPKEYRDMIGETFKEMARLWNEKHEENDSASNEQ